MKYFINMSKFCPKTPKSDRLLDEVSKTIISYPEIGKAHLALNFKECLAERKRSDNRLKAQYQKLQSLNEKEKLGFDDHDPFLAIPKLVDYTLWETMEGLKTLQSTYFPEKKKQESPSHRQLAIAEIPNFEDLLNEERRYIAPYLKSHYSGTRPREIAYMLFALKDLGIIKPSLLTDNKKELHSILEGFFGPIGMRQSLNKNIINLESANEYQERKITLHRKAIIKASENSN